MALRAPYLIRDQDSARDGSDWTPESSRRARAFAVWAALRSLGRNGVASLIDRCCEQARRFATALSEHPDIEVLNEVVLNQVLVRIGDDDSRTKSVASTVQRNGKIWLGHTIWHGKVALRISVSDHATTEDHVELAINELITAATATR
jgi:glutamate/tyrosine decarboxylase-like PLP-dependent enzyme